MKDVYDLTIREGRKDVSDRGKGRAACKKKALRQGFTKLVQGLGGGWPSVTGGPGMQVMGEEVGKADRGRCQAEELGFILEALKAMEGF